MTVNSWVRGVSTCALVFFLTGPATQTPGSAQAGEPPTLESLSDAWRNTLHSRFTIATQHAETSSLLPAGFHDDDHYVCVRQGADWSVFTQHRQSGSKQTMGTGFVHKADSSMNFVSVSSDVDSPMPLNLSQFLMKRLDLFSPKAAPSLGLEKEILEFWPSNGRFDPICMGVVDGVLINSTGLLANCHEIESSGETYIAKAQNEHGDVTVVFDAQHLLPTQITITQGLEAISKGRRLDEMKLNGGGIWPKGRVTKITHSIETEITQPGDRDTAFISRWKHDIDTYTDADVIVHDSLSATVSEHELNANMDVLSIFPPVKAGTQVDVEKAPQLSYAWDGTWAVPHAEVLADAIDSRKLSSSTRFRALLLANGIVIVCCLIYWMRIRIKAAQ